MFDLIQKQFPEFLIELHKIGSEILSSSMAAKQYDDFALFLGRLRSRLQGLGMQDDWDSFMEGIRKANARKKKLISIFDAHELWARRGKKL